MRFQWRLPQSNSPQQPPPTMSLLSLSRPFLSAFKSKQTSNGNPRFHSPPLFVRSLSVLSLRSLKLTSLNNPLSPPLLAAWQPPKYEYPDPIPEFAVAETEKFRGELRKKLARRKETFGDDIDAVVETCAEIFSEFLHKEYGGPGTLLVEPFTDMLLALKEKKLPGAPVAARAALLWAQNYVDQDWDLWNSQGQS